jgi:hypothetical protein
MPVRGSRNAFPAPGGKPTGMLSSRGKQKMDSTAGYNHKLLNYSLGGGGETPVKAAENKGLRTMQKAQTPTKMKAPTGAGPDSAKIGRNPGGSPKSPQCSPRSKGGQSPQKIK